MKTDSPVQTELMLGPFQLVVVQWQVLVAVMLRDIKTRFFGNEFGFLIAIGWPLSHILILLLINAAVGRVVPYGDSAALWFATGVVPFMAFSYMSRFIMLGIVHNRSLLIFPRVKITDILLARAIVELLSAGLVIIILVIIFWAYGINFTPNDPCPGMFRVGSIHAFRIGYWSNKRYHCSSVPDVGHRLPLIILFLWLTSGVFFVAHALPESLTLSSVF